MADDRCPTCGALYSIVGRRTHTCMAERRGVTNAEYLTVTNEPAAVSVTNAVDRKGGKTNSASRVARWRAKNPEAYRVYMRGLMAKKRAAQKAQS